MYDAIMYEEVKTIENVINLFGTHYSLQYWDQQLPNVS